MGQGTVKRIKHATPRERLKRREAILEVLARAADDSEFLAQLADNPSEALRGYYALTQEELAALISGDIKRIESWVGKLDRRLATWLWCRLSQENWHEGDFSKTNTGKHSKSKRG